MISHRTLRAAAQLLLISALAACGARDNGVTDVSTKVATTAQDVVNLVITPMGATKVQLSWTVTGPKDDPTSVRIYRDEQPIGWTTAPTWIDSTLQINKVYTYRVAGLDDFRFAGEHEVRNGARRL